MTTGKTTALTRQTFVDKVTSLLFNMLSKLVIAFLPRSKHLLLSWMQLPSTEILEHKKIKSLTVFIVSPAICMKWWDLMLVSINCHFSFCLRSSWYDKWFFIETWTFWYYVITFQILFKPSVLANFLWLSSSRGMGVAVKSMFPIVSFHNSECSPHYFWVGFPAPH